VNILYITTKSPLPTNDGHSLRTYNLLRRVAARHSVSLLSFVKFPVEYDYQQELADICEDVALFPLAENSSKGSLVASAACNLFSSEPFVVRKYRDQAMLKAISSKQQQHRIDLVHLDMLPLGVYLENIQRPVLLNAHNVESALLTRKADSLPSGPAKWYFAEQARRLARFERSVVARVTHVVACSDEDKELLHTMVPSASVSVVPNGVDTEHYLPGDSSLIDPARLAFVGGMNWFPNKDAVKWFDEEIIARVSELMPSTVLDVIGRPDGDMKLRHPEQIIMHGFVKDVREYLIRAAVVVVPIRVGGGTRLKVLEAMSMGKAMVSTTVGVEGIRAEHGKHLLLADTPEEFAQAVFRLQTDGVLRDRLGKAARSLATEHYQWDVIGQKLLDAYDTMPGLVNHA